VHGLTSLYQAPLNTIHGEKFQWLARQAEN
jgi:hypothetical protein